MNSPLKKSLTFFFFLSCLTTGFAQLNNCNGEFVNAGNYFQELCTNPNGGTVDLQGTASANVLQLVWSDDNGVIAQDNLRVEDYFVGETTTIVLEGIVIGDNQIVDGDFGSGDNFNLGFLGNYQTSFISEYVRGPLMMAPDPDGPPPPRDDPAFIPPLEDDGTYIVTNNSANGGFQFANCEEPSGQGGNIAVFNLGEDRDRIICTRVQVEIGRDYTFGVQVATVGEITFDDPNGDGGPTDNDDIENNPGADFDGDGLVNGEDCCPLVPTMNPGDCAPCMINGIADTDGDGIEDGRDNCPFVANPSQDPLACSVDDTDGDGVLDWQDNCVDFPNPGQEDRDGDGIGDACMDPEVPPPPINGGYCIPVLEFEIQGNNNQHTVIGEPHESDLEFCVWSDMIRTFTATTTGEIEICLRTVCPFNGGNLLAIDNLRFAETCRLRDEATIYVDNISANILPIQPLDCNTDGVLLEGEWDAIFDDINNIEFFWFEQDQAVLLPGATDEDYFVDEVGTYVFSVLNEETGCFADFAIPVEDNFSSPEAVIDLPDTLTCINQVVVLDASASTGGSDDATYIYQWNGVFGAEFLNGDPMDNSPIQEVIGSGVYELLVTNTFNGCTSETIIFVEENVFDLTLATPETNFELGCDSKGLEFEVETTFDEDTNLDDIVYVWFIDGVEISSSNQFESPTISTSGEYQLVVTNQSSGCSKELLFNVTGEAAGPEFVLDEVNEQITCTNPEVDLTASLITTTGVTYSWTDNNGVNLSPNGELELSVDEAGVYTFTAIDDATGCEVAQQVVVQGSVMDPVFTIAIPSTFDCNTSEIDLMGLLSNPDGDFTFTWMDANNQIIGNDINQEILEAGSYTLQVADNGSGCFNSVTINVFDNSAEPQFSLSQNQVLNCDNSESEIMLSSNEDNLSFTWTTTDGNIVNENGSSISVDMGGRYVVIVTDDDTGCTATSFYDLQGNFDAPNFDASLPSEISCDNPSSTLTINDFGSGLLYTWTASNGGVITSGSDSNNPVFQTEGDYLVRITNPNSGCSVEQSFTVTGNSLEPEIVAAGDGQLGCDDAFLPVSVSLQNAVPNISINWTSNNGGAFMGQTNVANASVTAAGTYQVVVTNLDNGCSAQADVMITQDNDKPEIDILNPLSIDCNNQMVVLDASATQIDSDFDIVWTSANGGVLDNLNSLNPQTADPDTYTLTITNPSNGCSSEASVTVSENNDLPIVDLLASSELSCNQATLSLGGGNSSAGNEFQYQWLDINRNAIPGANDIVFNVEESGTYTLIITNTNTGCSDERTIVVNGNADLPDVDAGAALQLDCQSNSGFLSGSAPSDATLIWSTTDGNIIGGANTLTPEINAEGTYILTATIQSTGCTASSTVFVSADMSLPNIDIVNPEAINCANSSIVIDATSSTDNGVSILWTNLNNNPITNPTTLTPEVNMPGEYLLTITDITTGCSTEELVLVQALDSEPVINIQDEVLLDCTTTISLIGDMPNPDYTYLWTSNNTAFTSNLAQIEVGEEDIYTLVVTDNNSACTTEYTVEVISEFESVEILQLDAEVLDCINQTITPNLELDIDLNDVALSWTTTNGAIDSGANSATPIFSSVGEYLIEITNLASGCISSQVITIADNMLEPEFDLGLDAELNCGENILQIGIGSDQQDDDYTYTWTDSQGGLISNSALLDIDAEGTYRLEVENTINGCVFSDQIVVSENTNAPEISAGNDDVLICGASQLSLNGSIISNLNNFEILWETENGRIESGENTLTPVVSQPGIYTLVLVNLDNQCSTSQNVEITPDMDAPVAVIEASGDLTCAVTSLVLNGQNTSGNGNLAFSWFRDGIAFDSDVNQVTIDSPGVYDLTVLDTDNNCATTTSITIEQLIQEPQIALDKSSDLDCDISQVNLNAEIDQNGMLIYEWTTQDGSLVSNADVPNPMVNAPGTYMLEVINLETGCSSTETITVEQDGAVPVFSLMANNDLTCENNQVEIVADVPSGNFELIWTNLSNNIIIDNPENTLLVEDPGMYQLEVLDSNNQCSSVRTIEVVENVLTPALDALQPLALSCEMTSATISVEILNNLDNVFINWTTIDGNISSTDLNSLEIEISSGGTYTVEVINTDNSCSNTIDLIVPENMDAPIFEIEEAANLTCENTQVSLSAIIDNPSPNQTILWTSLDGSIISSNDETTITVDAEGEYIIRIEDSSSACFEEQSVTVFSDIEDPIIDIDNPLELNCEQIEVGLSAVVTNAQNIEILWSTLNGNLTGENDVLNTTTATPGDYIILVTNQENGCTEEQTISVTQNIIRPSIQIEDAEELTCKNAEVVLSSSVQTDGSAALMWTTPDGSILGANNTQAIQVNQAGVYTLQVTDIDNNCISSETIEVEMNQDVPVGLDALITPPLCFGDLGSINVLEVDGGIGPYTFSIEGSPFDPSTDFDALQPGVYTISVFDSEECPYEETIVVPSTPQLTINLLEEVEILNGQSNDIIVNTNVPESEIEFITWTPSDFLSCDDCLTPIANPSRDIEYTVTIENSNGCIVSESISFRVQRILGVYAPNAFSPNDDFSNDRFTVYAQDGVIENIINLSIYDRWGNQVFEKEDFPANDENFGWNGEFRGENLAPDVYIFKAYLLLVNGERQLISGDLTLLR